MSAFFETPPKDPDARLDYYWDWTSWLKAGDTVVDNEFVVPADLTASGQNQTETMTSLFLAGGLDGTDYKIVSRVTTAQGRTDARTIIIPVRER